MTTMNEQYAHVRSEDGAEEHNRAPLLLVALAVVAIIGVQTAGSITSAFAAAAPQPDGTVDMARVLQTGPLPELAMGDANGVPVVEYGSLTCPHCAAFSKETFPQLKKEYIDTGKVRFIFREFARNTQDLAGFVLARCLGDREAFGADELLFAEQDKWAFADEPMKPLIAVMRLTGLTEEKARECLNNRKLVDAIVATTKTAYQETHLTGVPTFVIAGKVYGGELAFDQLKEILESLSPAESVPASAWAHTGTNGSAPARDLTQDQGTERAQNAREGCAAPQPSARPTSAHEPCR
ncbi:MAG: DsbA family protein [Hyphomicrobiales bacterium]|nr:DsbA family protein [Hyphomicrobiales bacterium]